MAIARVAAVDNRLRAISPGVKGQSARASGRWPEVIQLDEKSACRKLSGGLIRVDDAPLRGAQGQLRA